MKYHLLETNLRNIISTRTQPEFYLETKYFYAREVSNENIKVKFIHVLKKLINFHQDLQALRNLSPSTGSSIKNCVDVYC